MSEVCLECAKPLWVEGVDDEIALCHWCYCEGGLAKHYPDLVAGDN